MSTATFNNAHRLPSRGHEDITLAAILRALARALTKQIGEMVAKSNDANAIGARGL